jgi:hypothetical protein
MKLLGVDQSITQVAEAVERRLNAQQSLRDLSVTLIQVGDSTQAPESVRKLLNQRNHAVYDHDTTTIWIHRDGFFAQSEPAKCATLAHEIAHADQLRIGEPPEGPDLSDLPNRVRREAQADRLACQWGFFDEITELRGGCGDEYLRCLAQWCNIDVFYRCVATYFRHRSIRGVRGY